MTLSVKIKVALGAYLVVSNTQVHAHFKFAKHILSCISMRSLVDFPPYANICKSFQFHANKAHIGCGLHQFWQQFVRMHFAFLLRSKGHISINISLHHLSQIQFTKPRSFYEVNSLFVWLVPIASSGGIQSILLGAPVLCEIESGFIISHQRYITLVCSVI